jgi:hypothetical protein
VVLGLVHTPLAIVVSGLLAFATVVVESRLDPDSVTENPLHDSPVLHRK